MSKTLRELRIERGLTLGELASAMGCALSTPGSWERGQHRPSPRQIPRLAFALSITPEEARKAAEQSRERAAVRLLGLETTETRAASTQVPVVFNKND